MFGFYPFDISELKEEEISQGKTSQLPLHRATAQRSYTQMEGLEVISLPHREVCVSEVRMMVFYLGRREGSHSKLIVRCTSFSGRIKSYDIRQAGEVSRTDEGDRSYFFITLVFLFLFVILSFFFQYLPTYSLLNDLAGEVPLT